MRFVFLSATIPNASQFADWIAHIHHQPCHVVYTNYRPTPLQHYIFPQGGDGLHLVVDERGKFREANFQKAMATLQSGSIDAASAEAMLSSGNSKKRGRAKGNKRGGRGMFKDLHRIVKLITTSQNRACQGPLGGPPPWAKAQYVMRQQTSSACWLS